MNLHLFSTPGKDDIRYILEAARPYLEDKDDPVIAYIPAASLGDTYQGYTEKAFRGLARVATINTELMTMPEMEAISEIRFSVSRMLVGVKDSTEP